MKTVLLTVLTMIIVWNGLSAIGYKSAFVETEKAIEAARLEELENSYEKAEAGGGYFEDTPKPRASATYFKAKNQPMAIPAFDPMTDATSKLIYSLMDMIFLRFKQQLFISSVSQWKDEMLGSDFRYLFPNLAQLLNNTDSNNFLSSYDMWRSAIEKDIQETPLGLLDYSLHVLQKDPDLSYEEKALLSEMKNLMSDIYTFRNIDNLDEFIRVSTSSNTQQSQLFRLIGVIAKNMLDEDGDLVLEDLKEKIKDPYWRDQYLEIIQEDIDAVTINDDMFRVTADNLEYYLQSCVTVETFVTQLQPETRAAEAQPMKTPEYLKLYFTTCDNLIVLWSNLASSANNDWDSYYSYYTEYRFKIAEITSLIEEKQYKAVINNMISTAIELAEEHEFIPVPYTRFMNLISTIALTGNADEIDYRRVMDSLLEPVGSYAYKREADFSVTFNSYPGLGGGAETLNSNMNDAKGVAGLACPVGLELNWGHSILGFRGLFLSAFDLGAVATYRFTAGDSTDTGSPQIGLKQLVSPGLYLLIQKEEHPITLGIGAQMTPELRKITDSGTEKGKNALRVGAFVSVDIPLFTFYIKHNWLQ